jgi:hypothetical protein
VRPLPGTQRHFGSASERRVVHGRWGSRCRHGVGGARLAQPAAIVGRLLELAHSVLCGSTSAFGRYSVHTMGVPDESFDSSPDTFDPDRAGRSIVSIVRVPVRTGADIIKTPQHYSPTARAATAVIPPSSCLQGAETASKRRAWPSPQAMRASRLGLSSGGESGVYTPPSNG